MKLTVSIAPRTLLLAQPSTGVQEGPYPQHRRRSVLRRKSLPIKFILGLTLYHDQTANNITGLFTARLALTNAAHTLPPLPSSRQPRLASRRRRSGRLPVHNSLPSKFGLEGTVQEVVTNNHSSPKE
jgi:hypothetical protein